MTAITYQHCYRILRVANDCDWKELRLAFRRRVRVCHPDRMQPDGAGAGRDDEFKQVVHAYRALARFRQRHGELPPPYLSITDNTITVAVPPGEARAERPRQPEENSTAPARFAWMPPPFHRTVVVAFVCAVSAAALLDRLGHGDEMRNVPPAAKGRLAVGMDAQSVVNIQGAPNYTKGSVWFYGDSGVIFDKGCVVGWENQPPFPLRTLASTAWRLGNAADSIAFKRRECAGAN